MIISPSPGVTTNVLHAVRNAYKCTDLVSMLSQSEEDCNLYLQKLYWARDPEDPFEAPNFMVPARNLMLIREDLAGIDPASEKPLDGYGSRDIPYILFNQGGDATGNELLTVEEEAWANRYASYDSGQRIKSWWDPTMRDGGDYGYTAEDLGSAYHDAFWRWVLFRSYYPFGPFRLLHHKTGSELDLNDFKIDTAQVIRLQFGEERKIHAVLFYRPREGFIAEYADCQKRREDRAVQLLRLPPYSDTYEPVFDSKTSAKFQEPSDEVIATKDLGLISCGYYGPYLQRKYEGGVPCVVNLDTPIPARELFLRWSGHMEHFQILDSPVIENAEWILSDHPEMEHPWPFLTERLKKENPELQTMMDEFGFDPGRSKYVTVGDLYTGIRFASPTNPPKEDIPSDSYDYSRITNLVKKYPYWAVEKYSALCEWFGEGIYEQEPGSGGDIWTFENWGRPPREHLAYDIPQGELYDPHWFHESISSGTEGGTGDSYYDPDRRYFCTRDVGDNRYYTANKSLLKWYFVRETNSWKSNHTRPSTEDQMRLTVSFKEKQLVRGCINPMSNPATWNMPTFWADITYNQSFFKFEPYLYDHYLVPWRVLIEGRADDHVRTKWELMDEYTLQHFSTRAHTYFSYPREVQYIRITIQDWYGTTLMEDQREDYFQKASLQGSSTSPAQADHWQEYSNIYAPQVVRRGRDYTIGRCMDELVTTPIPGASGSSYIPDFKLAREEWQTWKARTIQSLWKTIYIPPFIFFGPHGEL
jgi:hypothetical protein